MMTVKERWIRMERYEPPFTITNRMLGLTAGIAEKVGKITGLRSYETRPYLRRNNRIRSVHSSLAIEANSLSLDEVRSVINGQPVIGPEKEIREVRNAYAAYEMLGSFDPFSLDDLKKLHAVMTDQIVNDSGSFRTHNEGVFNGDKCIFIAPPPQLVPGQMKALFAWMKEERNMLHPLILSSVFHYEFVFIHPFSDGNGRMARLWQTALLSAWNPVFANLPMESRIMECQNDYYEAIASCHAAGRSDAFIEFMLEMIDKALDRAEEQLSSKDAYLPGTVSKLMEEMEYDVPYTAAQLMETLGLKSKDNFRKLYLDPALERELIVRGIPDKPTSKNQTYIRK